MKKGRWTAHNVHWSQIHFCATEAGVVDQVSVQIRQSQDAAARRRLCPTGGLTWLPLGRPWFLSRQQAFLESLQATSRGVPEVNCKFKISLFRTRLSACTNSVVLAFCPSSTKDE